jgi:hypothetical protein
MCRNRARRKMRVGVSLCRPLRAQQSHRQQYGDAQLHLSAKDLQCALIRTCSRARIPACADLSPCVSGRFKPACSSLSGNRSPARPLPRASPLKPNGYASDRQPEIETGGERGIRSPFRPLTKSTSCGFRKQLRSLESPQAPIAVTGNLENGIRSVSDTALAACRNTGFV